MFYFFSPTLRLITSVLPTDFIVTWVLPILMYLLLEADVFRHTGLKTRRRNYGKRSS